MDEEKKPRSREKKVVSESRGVETYGEGLGTGPVGNMGGYADRKAQEQARQNGGRPAGGQSASPQQSPRTGSRPAGGPDPFSQSRPPQAGSPRPANGQSPFSQSRPPQAGGPRPANGQSPFTQSGPRQTGGPRPANGQSPFTQSRPQQTGGARPANGQSPFTQSRPQQTGGARPAGSQRSGSSSGSPQRSAGGGSKLILIVLALAFLLGGGKFSGLLDGLTGDGGSSVLSGTTGPADNGSSGTGQGSSSSGMMDLLSAFLGSSGTSEYDAGSDVLSLFGSGASTGSGSGGQSGASSGFSSGSSAAYAPATGVSKKARDKFTTIRGGKKDEVTVLVYLCGTDLESQNGMGTSDLKEMASAKFGKNVNLIVYTGGCRRWRNQVVSSSVNQIYQIQDGKLYCLEKDMGSAAMTNPATLTAFIRYGAEHFPANRMCLIFWDHGGGSVSGYGYDEKYASSGAMSLAGINTALKNAGQKFDFIGFDACLMATVENGIMLSQYADYMIASEETEPGVGWYYTNWLTKLGADTGMPTVEIGKIIADDFVAVCERQCRGQGTTLSVVDLAELQATVPSELTSFSRDTNELIQNNSYQTVSSARGKSREFAQSTRIDQIDLVHFALNMGTDEGKKLAKALQGAVKYNRTGGSMRNAYGLSIYFPYRKAGKLRQMVSTYQAIGMDEEYTRCIQEFASLELSGQAAAGTPMTGYGSQGTGMPSLLNSLLGGGWSGGYGGSYGGGISSSPDDMTDLLSSLFGGSSGDSLGFFTGRSMTAAKAAEYLSQHHLDASALVWEGDRITLPKSQWNEVESVARNVFVDNGKGYVDLGVDPDFYTENDALVDNFDGTWISIDRQPVAYYILNREDDGDYYAFTGYVPALLNGVRVNLMLLFDSDHPYGVIDGAEPVYANGETDAQAKNLIRIGEGDTLQFLCDFYDYEGNYQDSYLLGKPITLGPETEIANAPVGDKPVRVTYCFTDYYQQRYWTPSRDYAPSR